MTRILLDWSNPQHCIDCDREMRKPKSEFDSRPPHYGGGRCSTCYYEKRSAGTERRYDWSKPRYCGGCSRLMRPTKSKPDGTTVRHHGNGICINCAETQKRAGKGSKSRTKLQFDEHGQVCKYCDRYQDFSKFPLANHNPTGRRSKCSLCQRLWDAYRLTYSKYYELLESQGGTCATCPRVPEDVGALFVDHDHSCCSTERTCGRCVRGLLCSWCNFSIGHAGDSIEILQAMIKYLTLHSERIDNL